VFSVTAEKCSQPHLCTKLYSFLDETRVYNLLSVVTWKWNSLQSTPAFSRWWVQSDSHYTIMPLYWTSIY